MFISRYNYTRRSASVRRFVYVGCGAALFGLCAAVTLLTLLILPNAQGVALQVAGFRSAGDTRRVFEDQVIRPTPVLEQLAAADQITVNVPQIGERTFMLDNASLQAAVGLDSETARTVLQAQSDEEGLLMLCQQISVVCSSGTDQLRAVRFDLRPNGLIVNAEVLIPTLNTWQPLGVVFQQTGQRLGVVGVDVGGALYTNPPAPYDALVGQAETLVNDVLSQLSASVGGNTYALSDVYIDDQTLTLFLR